MSSVAYYSNNAWDNALLESVDLFSGRSTRLDEFFNTFGDDPTANFIRESLQFDLLCDTMNISKININEANEESKKSFGEHVKGLWKAFVKWVKDLWHKLVDIAKNVISKITGMLSKAFTKLAEKTGKISLKMKVIDKEKAEELGNIIDAIDVDDLVEKLATQARQRNAEAQEELEESVGEKVNLEELDQLYNYKIDTLFILSEQSEIKEIKYIGTLTQKEINALCKKIQNKVEKIGTASDKYLEAYKNYRFYGADSSECIKTLAKLSNKLKELQQLLLTNGIVCVKTIISSTGSEKEFSDIDVANQYVAAMREKNSFK